MDTIKSFISDPSLPESSEFKKANTFERRSNEAVRIKLKYPKRVPVVVDVHPSDRHEIALDKHKFLTPSDLGVSQFIYVIRKRIRLPPEKALFIFTGDQTLPGTQELMSSLYKNHKDPDGFLYLTISLEKTFG